MPIPATRSEDRGLTALLGYSGPPHARNGL
jgi:hypothetical protein